MRRILLRRILIVVVFACCAATFGGVTLFAHDLLRDNPTVLSIGDSTLYVRTRQGVTTGGFPELLHTQYGYTAINDGIFGASMDQVFYNLGARRSGERFDAVVIRAGYNDLFWDPPEDQLKTSAAKLMTAARSCSDTVVVVKWEVPNHKADTLNSILKECAVATGCRFVTADLVPSDFPYDDVHPAASGQKKIAAAVAAALR